MKAGGCSFEVPDSMFAQFHSCGTSDLDTIRHLYQMGKVVQVTDLFIISLLICPLR